MVKHLNEIIKKEKDNAIHASIHSSNKKINEEENLKNTVKGYLDDKEKEKNATQPLHDELSKHYKIDQHFDISRPIKDYTDDSYGVNNHLWKRHKKLKMNEEEKSYKQNIPKLDEAMERFKTPKSFTVHSGINYDPTETKNSENVVHHPAYLSTSIRKDTAMGFGDLQKGNIKHILSINVPKGHKGVYVGDHSELPGEREFILPRGTNLKHEKTTIEKHKHLIYKDGIEIHTHHMSIV
jgi:hypothetical protein